MANFDNHIMKLLSHEGGYVNDPADRNGRTYRGISYRAHPNWQGWHVVDKQPRKRGEIIPELEMLVIAFYKANYWAKIKLDNVCNERVAGFIFDWFVNSGHNAIKQVQKIVGVTVDGIMGDKTVFAINNFDNGLFEKLKMARIGYVKSIVENDPKQGKFLNGWLKRINSL